MYVYLFILHLTSLYSQQQAQAMVQAAAQAQAVVAAAKSRGDGLVRMICIKTVYCAMMSLQISNTHS